MTVATLEIGLDAARFKAAETVATGLRTLEFYAAAFSAKPDKNGDIIAPHAFDRWLPTFYTEGKALSISFNHAGILDALDPTNIIGYAPADPQHVWVDDYGLRVSAFIDTGSEKGKAVEWQIENGLLLGASLAFEVPAGGFVKKNGYNLITEISAVREAGPVPNPANQAAVLLWMKSAGLLEQDTENPYMTVEEFRATFLKTPVPVHHTETVGDAWDGPANKGRLTSGDAKNLRGAFAWFDSKGADDDGDGYPDAKSDYVFIHHQVSADGTAGAANLTACSTAIGVLNGGRGVNAPAQPWYSDRQGIYRHLAAHIKDGGQDVPALKSEEGATEAQEQTEDVDPELKHRSAGVGVQAAHDALVRAGAKCASAEMSASDADETDEKAEKDELAKLREEKLYDEATWAVEQVQRASRESIAGERVLEINRKLRILESSLP